MVGFDGFAPRKSQNCTRFSIHEVDPRLRGDGMNRNFVQVHSTFPEHNKSVQDLDRVNKLSPVAQMRQMESPA